MIVPAEGEEPHVTIRVEPSPPGAWVSVPAALAVLSGLALLIRSVRT